MKNFDSVPQLQMPTQSKYKLTQALATRITVLQDRVRLAFAAMSLLASAKAITSSVVMRAGRLWLRWTAPGASKQSPEPLVRTVEGDSDRAVNRIELNRIESFSFLPNRPSLPTTSLSSVDKRNMCIVQCVCPFNTSLRECPLGSVCAFV